MLDDKISALMDGYRLFTDAQFPCMYINIYYSQDIRKEMGGVSIVYIILRCLQFEGKINITDQMTVYRKN